MTVPGTSVALLALSWASPRTTEMAMRSWRRLGHPAIAQRLVWYQQIDDNCVQQARHHGFEAIGTSSNVGISAAYAALLERTKCDYACFLECDWILTARRPDDHFAAALELARTGTDVVRLRSRTRPGWPLNTIVVRGAEETQPQWTLETCYWMRRPDRRFPQISTTEIGSDSFFVTASSFASWTNNPHLAATPLLQSILERSGGQELEPAVNEWWAESDLTVAQGRGLFTHQRVDGPSARSGPVQRLKLNIKRAMPAAIYQALRR